MFLQFYLAASKASDTAGEADPAYLVSLNG